MADGSGYKIWIDDEQVNANEFQGYLQRQVVSSHVDTTSRDAAITAVPEGHQAVSRHTNEVFIGDQGDTFVPWGRYGDWGTYTPALTAVTTSPTLGTNPVQEGRFTRHGTHATVHVNIVFGTSSAAGTGIYEIDLPTTCQAASALFTAVEQVIGHGIARDSSTGTIYHVAARVVGADIVRFETDQQTGDTDASTPVAWGDGDTVFNGTLHYETEPGP
jgi:hypothetical protein